jgi:predicted DNA binding CopG/RHH family protein
MSRKQGGVIKFSERDDDSKQWEDGALGRSPEHAKKVSPEQEKEMDDALGLAPVTLRLQKSLVEQLKKLAAENGLGYQPFVRQILTHYVRDTARTPVASK